MDQKNLMEDVNAFTGKINELDNITASIQDRMKYPESCSPVDLVLLSKLSDIEQSIKFTPTLSIHLSHRLLDEYYDWINKNLSPDLSSNATDEVLYALYNLSTNWSQISKHWPVDRFLYWTRFDTTKAIYYLGRVKLSHNFCQKRRTIIEFPDGTGFYNKQISIPYAFLDNAFSDDNAAEFNILMHLNGKKTTLTLLRYLIQNHRTNILADIIRNDQHLARVLAPEKLLLLTLSHTNMNELPSVQAIENTHPGTISSAKDASGRNALMILRLHAFEDTLIGVTCCYEKLNAVEEYLINHGCDPDCQSQDGFSWRALKRLGDIVNRFE